MAEPTFEQSLGNLEEIVTQLEQGELPLTEALKRFEKGMALVKTCRKELDQVEIKLTNILSNQEEEA